MTETITQSEERPTAWSGPFERIDLPMARSLAERRGWMADCFVCGCDGFVKAASVLLMQAGQSAEAIRTERFNATGPLLHERLVSRERSTHPRLTRVALKGVIQ